MDRGIIIVGSSRSGKVALIEAFKELHKEVKFNPTCNLVEMQEDIDKLMRLESKEVEQMMEVKSYEIQEVVHEAFPKDGKQRRRERRGTNKYDKHEDNFSKFR